MCRGILRSNDLKETKSDDIFLKLNFVPIAQSFREPITVFARTIFTKPITSK